jgi:hypothetical protein
VCLALAPSHNSWHRGRLSGLYHTLTGIHAGSKMGCRAPPVPAQSTKIAKLISCHGLLESVSGLQRLKPRFRHGGHLHDAHGGEMPIDCAWRVSSPTSDFAKVRLLSHATAAAVGTVSETVSEPADFR